MNIFAYYCYVGNDKYNIGFISNEFMHTDSYITTSVFTYDSTSADRRYFSTNVILSLNNSPHRFASSAYAYYGQSGGMTFFKPYNNYKSTVGIVTNTTFSRNKRYKIKYNSNALLQAK